MRPPDYPRYGWNAPWAGPPPQAGSMRVSDAERAGVTDALIRHAADGRLDDQEYQDRVARATAARTRADLAPLLADLPPLGDPDPPPPHRRAPGWIVAVFACMAVWWVVTGLLGAFFFHVRAGGFFLVLVALLALRWARPSRRRRRYL